MISPKTAALSKELDIQIAKMRQLDGFIHEEDIYAVSAQRVLLYVIDRSNKRLPPIPTEALDTLFKMYVAEALVEGRYYGKEKDGSSNLTKTKERNVNLDLILREDRKKALLAIKENYDVYVDFIKKMEKSLMSKHWASFDLQVEKDIMELKNISGIDRIARMSDEAVEQPLPFMQV